MGERALREHYGVYVKETDLIYADLNALNRENALDELQEKQYEYHQCYGNSVFSMEKCNL